MPKVYVDVEDGSVDIGKCSFRYCWIETKIWLLMSTIP